MNKRPTKKISFIAWAIAVALTSVAIFAASWLLVMFIEMDMFWPIERGWRVYFALIVGIVVIVAARRARDWRGGGEIDLARP
jgi:hypothetical protein